VSDRDLCLTPAVQLVRMLFVPAGFTREGFPVGIEIVGRRRQEATVLGAAAAFEAATPWADRIPPVVAGSARA
jgi:amidase